MDDGSWDGSGILLHTNSFTKSDVTMLANMLTKKFGINTSLRSKGNNYIIYIKSNSIFKVRDLSIKYVHPQFLYKFGLKTKQSDDVASRR
jgi:hypothetical protein